MSPAKSTPATKLFLHDIIRRKSDPSVLGIVQRCWHDAEDIPPEPTENDDDLERPLKRGEFVVSLFTDIPSQEIVSETELELVDRTIPPGQFCKRSIDDFESAKVLHFNVKAKLAHAIAMTPVDGWWTLEDIEVSPEANVGDYVEYDDWIGQVIEIFDDVVIRTPTGEESRLPDIGSKCRVGDSCQLLLYAQADAPDPPKGLVISVRHVVYAITWLALNQTLEASVAERKSRPKRFWYGDEIGKLTLVRGHSDIQMRVGDRVKLKKPVHSPADEVDLPSAENDVYFVKETSTTLTVRWQSGVEETILSRDVIPYLNPDEYDVWPGEYVLWRTEDGKRIAVVQSANAEQRTAQLVIPETQEVELAPLLELDGHGGQGDDHEFAEFGVTIGDFVFIHNPGSTNGLPLPRVPKIGEVEEWAREPIDEHGGLESWRTELEHLGRHISKFREKGAWVDGKMKTVPDATFNWFGEVTGLNMDGTVVVTLPNFSSVTYPIDRLTRLYDGMEQLEDGVWDDGDQDMGAQSDGGGDGPITWLKVNGNWETITPASAGYWDEASDGDGSNGGHSDEDVSDGDDSEAEVQSMVGSAMELADDDDDARSTRTDAMSIIDDDRMSIIQGPDFSSISKTNKPTTDDLDRRPESPSSPKERLPIPWKTFDILPSAPADHAFYRTPSGQHAKNFLSRLTKEYRILSTSLPDSIVVRAYEDRTDLLRTLIIGPANTPYEDAPFVIDWMLDSNFPQSPPVAHFHSWTNGNGRVNPNLYEEGKVCLSILGTWNGDKTETWSASRSSLLQAFVSIQGLVLVKEPWFCEPAFEKLRGTEEATVNSRLYNETAYILARGFVRRALETPLGSLQDELKLLYIEQGRLAKVLKDAEALIEKSKKEPSTSKAVVSPSESLWDYEVAAVPRLTAGGIIALERTLAKLQSLLASLSSTSDKGS